MRKAATITMLFCLILSGVGSVSARQADYEQLGHGQKALEEALNMIGLPYRYRGDSPSTGFDCSGLVRYSYLAAGIDLPHGTAFLLEITNPVEQRDLQAGDLVFFEQRGRAFSHVGMYAGENRFIHAPGRGKHVRVNSLEEPYWKKHFLGGRRVDISPAL